MRIYEHIFRTNDIRGKFPDQFSSETVLNLGRSFGNLFGKDKTIVIGNDVRISSPIIKSTLSAGLMEAGINVLDVGICTTPIIYFLSARNSEIDGGIMITASHNPIDYNGIKVCDANGVAFHKENFFIRVREMMEKNKISIVKNTEYGQLSVLQGINSSQYWQFQKKKFKPNKPLSVAIENGNGTCFPVVKLLKSKGMKVEGFNIEPDGHFPVMIPDPTNPSCLESIINAVIEHKLDIGIGFDVDGDRVGFVDDEGKIISPDQIIMLFCEDLLEKYPKAEILIDVKTSRATFEYLTNLGANVEFTRVGHSWIHENLLKSEAIFAGELSGHYYFGGDYYGFDDAIYSALRMLEILSIQEHPLSKVVQNLPQYHASKEHRIPCSEDVRPKVISNLIDVLKEEAIKSITIDGIRAEFEDGWILVRESGTEPIISIRVEATTYQRMQYYEKYIKELIIDEKRKVTKSK